ncbi:hypothetical protein KAJ61_04435 [Candidatus Parcubacteria bacterium]|nr:hypothetical protein [Candidatus Parcubacteria bacterium]
MKKFISVMMSLIVLAIFSSIAISADDWCCQEYSQGNPYSCYDTGNCTWWAYHKRADLAPAVTHNAVDWFARAVAEGKLTGQIPVENTIAVYNVATLGHVVYVKSVGSDGLFQVSEMGYNEWLCLHEGSPKVNSSYLLGFIYGRAIKFSDSGTVYLYSNNQLWPMLNETTYVYLGFGHSNCSFTANWDYVTELPASTRGNYDIREETIPSARNPVEGKYTAYKIIAKVGPNVCSSMQIDSTKIYLFGSDSKFHHIINEQVYFELGYDWDDIVEISPDLFDYYGEGEAVENADWSIMVFPEVLTVPLFQGWNYGLGHAYTAPIAGDSDNITIKYQQQEIPISQAIDNGWVYGIAYLYDSGWSTFNIVNGQFDSRKKYYIYSFVSGAELTVRGNLESGDKQAVIDMSNIANQDSKLLFEELCTLQTIPDWSPYWTLRAMAYQIASTAHVWFNHATNIDNPSIRYVAYFNSDTGQWTNWQMVY